MKAISQVEKSKNFFKMLDDYRCQIEDFEKDPENVEKPRKQMFEISDF
jgi:hypothetical protein